MKFRDSMHMTTDELVQVMINRIGDYEADPEPVHDGFLEKIPIHMHQQLKHALIQSYIAYKKEASQG